MRDQNKRFPIIILLLCVVACSLIAGYFYYLSLTPELDNMSRLQAMLKGDKSNNDSAPSTKAVTTSGPILPANTTSDKPDIDVAKVEFESKLAGLAAGTTDADLQKTSEKYALPPPRLAPDMFTFFSLPSDAPFAEFPLVLVGQKNLEWVRTRSGTDGGGAMGVDGSQPSSIYGNPHPKPPPTPPGPPGPPGPPPGPPPNPPPEVSTSGL